MESQDITYQEKLNDIKFNISHPKNQGINFVLVEGDSDIRLFRKLFDSDKCKVECVPGGKPKVKDCVAELLPEYALIVGVLDADFSHLEKTNEEKDNIFLTDYHDIEMTILAQDEVLHAILLEYSDIPKNEQTTLRDNILKSIEKISYLKWLNDRETLKLKFKETNIKNLIFLPEFQLNFNEYLSRILAKSDSAVIKDKNLILQKINELTQLSPDLLQLTNGHDALQIFTKYLRDIVNVKLSDKNVESIFRMVFTTNIFRQTNLFEALKSWANKNDTQLFTT